MEKIKEENENDEILINKLLTGSYMDDNIGHEVINFFRADDGKHYVYISPYGKISEVHKNKIKYVLFATPQNNRCYYIYAKAEVKELKLKKIEQIEKITYGNKNLYDIFSEDRYSGDEPLATFEVDKYYKIKDEFKIKIKFEEYETKISIENKENNGKTKRIECVKEKYKDKDGKEKERKKFYLSMSENCKAYICKNAETTDEKELFDFFDKNIIKCDEIWKEENYEIKEIQEKEIKNINSSIKNKCNFIKMCKKEYDETIYTNLIYYFLKNNKELFEKFLKELIKKQKIKNSKEFKIEREKNIDKNEEKNVEKGRIDLWLEDEKNAIIIENKIKSKINGKRNEGNQLTNYWNYAKSIGKENICCFMLVPNYYDVETDEDFLNAKEIIERDKIIGVKTIEKINYDEVYRIFKEYENEINEEEKKYFIDFTEMIEMQSKSVYEREKCKFMEACKKAEQIKEYVVFIIKRKKYEVKISNNIEKTINEIAENKENCGEILVAFKIKRSSNEDKKIKIATEIYKTIEEELKNKKKIEEIANKIQNNNNYKDIVEKVNQKEISKYNDMLK